MDVQVKPFIHGNILLLICCVFYLAWWMIAFKPEGAVRGLKSGWLLIPAALAGVLAVFAIVNGISKINMANAAISSMKIGLMGIAVYIILFAITWFLMRRPVTTELLLIVGWVTMVAAEINGLRTINALSQNGAIGLLIVSVIMAAVSLACYLVYYKLDAVKGYYDGAVPLVIVAVMSCVMLIKLRL